MNTESALNEMSLLEEMTKCLAWPEIRQKTKHSLPQTVQDKFLQYQELTIYLSHHWQWISDSINQNHKHCKRMLNEPALICTINLPPKLQIGIPSITTVTTFSTWHNSKQLKLMANS
jgi:hypothetical protein